MKLFYSSTLCIFALMACSSSLAQTNAPITSSLQANRMSPEERINFLMNVAQSYFQEKDYESAVNAYERVLQIDPMHEQARYIISHVYINAKEYKKAETLLLQLKKDYPENFQILNNLAWLYATAEDARYRSGPKAIKLAQEAMVLAPNDHHVWSTLSEAYYITGDYEKAYRAIKHMASLATRYGKGITKETVESYNEQIMKCKRAMETAKALEEE